MKNHNVHTRSFVFFIIYRPVLHFMSTLMTFHVFSLLMISKYGSSLTVKFNLSQNSIQTLIQTWVFKRKFKLEMNNVSIMMVVNPLQTRNLDFPSDLEVDQFNFTLSTKMRNLRVNLGRTLTLNYKKEGC